ncbi:MAG: hypothetical protein JW811_02630 [Clostridiales bacterium]|nr:hypothetical protein [Clostridiales bacterium]
MLGKLMKYEFKATARVFLPLYAALLVMAAVTKLMFSLQWETPQIISLVLSIILMVAAFVITLILTIQRFYKNFLTTEGYLMFTLPVTTDKLMSGKLLVAMIWNVVCAGVVYLALSIMAFSGAEWSAMIEAIRSIGLPPADLTFFTIEFVALILLSLASSILTIYASMALSMVSNKHRVALSFAFYIGLTTVMQILTTVIFLIFLIPNTHMTYVYNEVTAVSAQEFFTADVIATIHNWAGVTLFITLGFGAAMYFLTRFMLKSKLNLQ